MNTNPPIKAVQDCWNQIGVWGDGSCTELAAHAHCRNCPVYSRSAKLLLDRPWPDNYRAEWARHYAREKLLTERQTEALFVFRIGTEWLGLPGQVLREVSGMKPIHSLPHRRQRLVRGVVNVRGELLACVSLGELLGIELRGAKAPRVVIPERLVVIEREGERVVFPASEVHGNVRYRPTELRDVPATVARATATYTKGILPWQERAVGCLDDELLFYTLNRSLA